MKTLFVMLLAVAAQHALFTSPCAYAAGPLEPLNLSPASDLPPISDNPSDDEIGRARLFPQRIVPVKPAPLSGLARVIGAITGKKPAAPANGNPQLAAVLRKVQQSPDRHDHSALQEFVKANPQSRWAPALRFESARRQFAAGFFSQAVTEWDAIWEELKDRRDAGSVAVADEVLSCLLDATIGLSKADRLTALIGDEEARPGNGVIEAKITRAKQAVWLLKHKGAQNVMCGPVALYCILKSQNQPFLPIRLDTITDDYIATGISLSQIQKYSDQYGMRLMMARKTPGASIPTPAIMHLATGHYSTLLTEADGKYLLIDRPMQFQGWVSPEALEAQASGCFLIPSGPLPQGWQPVSENEGNRIFGRDGLHGQQPLGLSVTADSVATGGDNDTVGFLRSGAPDGWAIGTGGGAGSSSSGGGRSCSGMARYTFHPQVASVRIQDSPVGYSPPVGPSVFFAVAYNDLDDSKPPTTPAFSNVGLMWSVNWVAYVDHVSGALFNGIQLKVHISGGGAEVSSYSSATGAFGPNDRSFTTVVRSGSYTYTRTFPDGSTEVYNSPDNVSTPNRVFLTQRIDSSGNVLSFSYDANMRLVSVTDTIGRVTTLEYTLPSDIWKVTKVTDPFGRFATLTYNASNELASVTDVLGLTSSFIYDGTDFITSMTTPYGTTTFQNTRNSVAQTSYNFIVTATDPQGDKEQVQYIEPIDVPGNEPPLPATINVGGTNVTFVAETGRQQFRNSFYWSKKAMKDAPGDTSAARNYRWFTDIDYRVTPVLEATKEPFESRVWFNYPSQGVNLESRGFSYYAGLGARPEKTLRILDDGTPQLTQTYYNSLGRTTNAVDPLGRSTTFTYAANQIDLLEVRQKTGPSASDRLALFTYNSQHLPLTAVDAAGQTSTFTYNARGQPLTVTNPKGETTILSYDVNGFLTSIDGPLPGTSDTTTLTYDATSRVRTITDSDGYTVTYDYDVMDRPTKITYPDATFEQFTYDRLDRTVSRDRLGRQTLYTYNSLQQLLQVQDALNRIVRFDWCRCGALRSLADALGRVTSWQHDVQGRPMDKQYADGSKIRYVYETNTSRLKQMVDEKGQVTQYQYYMDNALKQVAYSNSAIATPPVSFIYDANYGRAVSMTDGIGTTTYAYNPIPVSPTLGAGRLASVDGPLTNDTITYQYDQLGRITNRAVNGVASVLTFDALGRPTSTANALGTFSYAYDGPTRRLASMSYPNGQSSAFTYLDNLGDHRLQQITNLVGSTQLSQFNYAYDVVGNITSWVQQAGTAVPKTNSFGYDAADQLLSDVISQNGSNLNTYSYSYDLAGNRKTEQIGASARQFFYNSLNEITTTSAGAVTATTNEWDAVHRLTAINQGSNRTEFSYDGLGRRVRIVEKQNGSVVSDKRFVWCGLKICEERDSAGITVNKRYFGQGVKIGTTNLFYTRDHLGSIREMTDSGGANRARYDYDPYGRRTKTFGDLDCDFGFTGLFFHTGSGLCLAPYRAYDVDLARWISRDPVGLQGGVNLYSYVENNPLNRVDLLGLSSDFSVAVSGPMALQSPYLPNSGATVSWEERITVFGEFIGIAMVGVAILEIGVPAVAVTGGFVAGERVVSMFLTGLAAGNAFNSGNTARKELGVAAKFGVSLIHLPEGASYAIDTFVDELIKEIGPPPSAIQGRMCTQPQSRLRSNGQGGYFINK